MHKNLKIKKTGTFILCAFIFTFFFLFATACSKSSFVYLNMDYYTLNNSSYELITESGEKTAFSSDYLNATPIFRQYDKITINLSSEWLYLFYASTLSFDLTTSYDCLDQAGHNTALQFNVVVTNLAGGAIDGGYGTKIRTYTIVCEQKATQPKTYSINIGDYFEKSADTTAIVFTLSGTEAYIEHEDFAFSLNSIKLYGDHQYN